jgi:sulfatase modifying factor 1
MKHNSILKYCLMSMVAVGLLSSCKKDKSSVTGYEYNSPKWGGFEKHAYLGQETGPGLVLVEGGTFTMGVAEQDLLYEHNSYERRITVHSFYMDETEVSNIHYREYEAWSKRVYSDFKEVIDALLPDTNTWRSKLAFNEPFVDYYYRHPAYQDYPVVGVNWHQATNFAAWRGDRVNEVILDREGFMKMHFETENEDNTFNTRAYLAGQYEFTEQGHHRYKYRNYASKKKNKPEGRRMPKIEDGILLPEYRLPTEAEWEFAASADIGNSQNENIDERKIYPWNELTVRFTHENGSSEKDRGKILQNFRRGRGDLGGLAGNLNDAGIVTTPVFSYWPNAYGLYNMAGNVSEWVMDVYRPLSPDDKDDFNSFRGNVYKKVQLDQYGEIDEKDSMGRLVFVDVTAEENVNRRNYKISDNIGFKDEMEYQAEEQMYEYGVTSLINNKARVYKGGSWNDRAYFTSPGTRRYLDEEQNLPTLGFRCAMIRLGSPTGNDKKRNKYLPSSGSAKRKRK